MTEWQYARNVQPLRLRTELIYPSFRGKIADFPLVYDQTCLPEAPVYIETYHAYAPGTGDQFDFAAQRQPTRPSRRSLELPRREWGRGYVGTLYLVSRCSRLGKE